MRSLRHSDWIVGNTDISTATFRIAGHTEKAKRRK
jgi:hypothetical protein